MEPSIHALGLIAIPILTLIPVLVAWDGSRPLSQRFLSAATGGAIFFLIMLFVSVTVWS